MADEFVGPPLVGLLFAVATVGFIQLLVGDEVGNDRSGGVVGDVLGDTHRTVDER